MYKRQKERERCEGKEKQIKKKNRVNHPLFSTLSGVATRGVKNSLEESIRFPRHVPRTDDRFSQIGWFLLSLLCVCARARANVTPFSSALIYLTYIPLPLHSHPFSSSPREVVETRAWNSVTRRRNRAMIGSDFPLDGRRCLRFARRKDKGRGSSFESFEIVR